MEKYKYPYTMDDIVIIAKKFSISREIIVRRLLDTNFISNSEYKAYINEIGIEIERRRKNQELMK